MFGMEQSIVQLAVLMALFGLVPSAVALAADRLREAPGSAGPVLVRSGKAEADHRLARAAPVDAAAAIAAAGRAGYGAVTEVEWKRGAWRLRARDAAGAPAQLQVDGWTGQVAPRPR